MIFASRADFVRSMREVVRAYDDSLAPEVVDLVVAFFAHEVGFGTGGAYPFGHHNLGNVTVPHEEGKDPAGTEGVDWDRGRDHDAAGKTIPQFWAIYQSDLDSVTQWFGLLERHYSIALGLLKAGNAPQFLAQLRLHGYYVLSLEKYAFGFNQALAEVQGVSDGASSGADQPTNSGGSTGGAGPGGVIALGLAFVALFGGLAVFFALR